MRTNATQNLPPGLYRPGSGFSAAELHIMVHEGALRPLLGDLYACSSLPDAPGLRALACRALLSGSLRAHAVLCGESAAWVHLGSGSAPTRITVITAGVYRRRTAGLIPWQVHQVPLRWDEQLELQSVPVTSPLRTAADLFLGIGTVASRRPLDVPRTMPGPETTASTGSVRKDGCAERWTSIRRLCLANPEQIQPAPLLRQILEQLGGRNSGPDEVSANDDGHSAQARDRLRRSDVSCTRRDRIESLLAARVFGG